MAPASEECKMQHSCFSCFLHSEKKVGMQVSLVTMSHPSLRTVALPSCLPLGIKDSLNEDMRFFDGELTEGF
jgi:hypothetical protein